MPKLNWIVSQIEAMRQRGFAEGGMVWGVTNHNVTKNQTNHISVSNQIDLRAFLDRAKRKM
jgi:hypothetical protein